MQYRGQEMGDQPPHVYAIAEDAYQQILAEGSNQSILVSGESGAGKTESVKIMMQYLAVVSKSGHQNKVAAQVLASNPLLEAFGNARTMRNNNSSRFGKFIEIQFDRRFKMSGARIHIYLLEKSRVIQQSNGERNYHVFYQLLAGLPAEERASIHLSAPIDELTLLNQSGCIVIDGIDDAAELKRTREAMDAIGMEEAEHVQVIRTLAAVLLLAQVAFTEDADEHASVDCDTSATLQAVVELLGTETTDELNNALCTRQLVTRDDVVTVPLTLEQARDSRDALTKSIYGKLFSWLVERCNGKLVDDDAAAAFVGILDIFGFESFKVNSFEQLCINYANERLQQQFNRDVFKSEQAEYEAEAIEWKYIEFIDNQECLDLIDRKENMGILHVLDEECAIQKGSDENLAQKLRERHAKHAYFLAPKREQLSFTVRHYAGDVTYFSRGFREKNKDALHPDLSAVMQASQSSFVRGLFPADAVSTAASAAPRKAKGGKSADRMTVGSQFMTQLASLMRTIGETDVHYVRCIKPNTANQPRLFEMAHTALQLRCAGVLEAVRISRMAYPNRMLHGAFVRRYAVLTSKAWLAKQQISLAIARDAEPGDAATADLCAEVLKLVVEDCSRFQLGKTKVFFRAFLLEALEKRRSAALSVNATVLQKRLRGLLCQQRYRLQRSAALRVQSAQRRHAAQRAYAHQHSAIMHMQAAWRGRYARQLVRQLRSAVRIQATVRTVLARRRVVALRRNVRATRLQASVRRRARERLFRSQRHSALRLQSSYRMASQQRQYRRELAEKREEAKLSTQLAKMQARLQAEIDARQKAEEEQERLRAERANGAAYGAPGAEAGAGLAASSASALDAPTTIDTSMAAAMAPAADAAQAATISGRLAGAAAKYLSGYIGTHPQTTSSMEETNAMLSLVTKDREKLSQRLAVETEARKRLESEKRELERKFRLGSATSQLETRKTRDMAEALNRKKDELAELKALLQRQTLEISNLQSTSAAKEKRLHELEKKMSQYDDSFYALEARNVRDRTKMEEFAKAKSRAEEERAVYRHMLEQSHERAMKERQELRRDAQSKLEAGAARLRSKKVRVQQLEKELREKSQVEEEKNAYREQCQSLMEQCQTLVTRSSLSTLRHALARLGKPRQALAGPGRAGHVLAFSSVPATHSLAEHISALVWILLCVQMQQLSAAHGGQPTELPPARTSASSVPPASPQGLLERIASRARNATQRE